MATGFMFQIVNKCPFQVSFSSSNYQGTGDISPFNFTLAAGETAPGAPQNPGYYYFEAAFTASSAVASDATFDVVATPIPTVDVPTAPIPTMQIGPDTPVTLTVKMTTSAIESYAQNFVPGVMQQPYDPPADPNLPPASVTLAMSNGVMTVSLTPSGTTGKDDWQLGVITATYTVGIND